jgi:TFIIF-interacting CTD phosphatase-like protein
LDSETSDVSPNKVEVNKKNGYYVWHRPFAHASLWFLNQLFNVHVFTAATKDYGESCIEAFPGYFEKQRFYRDSVTKKDSHGKDLSLIVDDLSKIVLVDDQARNRTNDQLFYHIPPYTRFIKLDFELPKFC